MRTATFDELGKGGELVKQREPILILQQGLPIGYFRALPDPDESIPIAADTMVIMSAATGGAAARVFKAPAITVVTTDFNMGDVKQHLPPLIDKYCLDPDDVADALASLPLRIYRWDEYESPLAEARVQMEWKDPKDVALLALSLKLGIDVWSQDLHYDALSVKRMTTGQIPKSLGQ